MTGAFTFFVARTTANLARHKLAQLRNPRYAIAMLLGLVYLWGMLGRRSGPSGAPPGPLASHLELITALGVTLVVGWTWMFGRDRRALAFSPAEVTFLFTAPVPRRTLIQFKLVRAQGIILLNTLLWSVLLSGERFGAHAWMRGASVWTPLSTLYLHRLGASFVRTSLTQHRAAAMRHRVVSIAAMAIVIGTVVLIVASDFPALMAARGRGVRALLDAVEAAFARPLPSLVLAPFRIAVRPLAQHQASEWLRAVGPALVLLALHFVWVVRSDTAFEEAAAEASFSRARALESGRRGTPGPRGDGKALSPAPFRLGARGHPAMAIYWKNLIAAGRRRRAANVALGFAAGAAALAFLAFNPIGAIGTTAGTLIATWGILSLVAGPQWVRNDLRTDLARLDILRSFPLRGAALVAAEAAASTTILTLVQMSLMLLAYVAFLGDAGGAVSLRMRTIALVAAGTLLPAVNFLSLLIQNGAALLFPAWVRIGPVRGGVEAVGQNLVMMIAHVIVLAAGLALPVLAGAAVFWVARPAVALWALVPAIAVLVGAVGVECVLLLRWLGRVFEQIDIAESGIPAP